MTFLSKIKSYRQDTQGNFAVIAAISMMVILLVIGVALDYSRLASVKQYVQGQVDTAALAGAISMKESSITDKSLGQRKKTADEIAKNIFSSSSSAHKYESVAVNVTFPQNEEVRVTADAMVKPYLMHMFGYEILKVSAEAGVNIGQVEDIDLDIALVSDVTFSMVDTLSGIQQNMTTFASDLSKELNAKNIEVGDVRVKFVFFRDFMIDNHTQWTGPSMIPDSDMERWGPMYTSQFYNLPDQEAAANLYVNSFNANGGGGYAESSLEALWYTLSDSNWKTGEDAVRAIVLWTDAPTRAFNDKSEYYLTPGTLPFWDEWLPKNIGDHINSMTKSQREDYMVENFYPQSAPSSTSALKAMYDSFHEDNANGINDVQTMTINILDDCQERNPCGEWPNIATWDGIDYHYDNGTNTSSETYDKILDQVVETVQKQIIAKDIAIKY